MPSPPRFMLDSMVLDELVESEPDRRAVVALIANRQIELFTTHIQEDELARITDEVKRWRVKSLPRTIIPTSDFVVGVSRLGMARLGSGRVYELIRHGQSHVNDALIAATAEHEGHTLVTSERRLKNRAAAHVTVPVWNGSRLLAEVRRLARGSEGPTTR